MRVNYHPAPGLGDLLPGYFVVPQNPVRDAEGPLVPSVQALAAGAVLKKPHMGEFLPATFAVPQNPIRKSLATNMNGLNGMGCGCGGGQSCGCASNFYGMSGLGANVPFSSAFSSMANFEAWAQQPSPVSTASLNIPNWALWGGAIAIAAVAMSSSSRRR